MRKFAIFRFEKLKTKENLKGALLHATRGMFVPNSDSERLKDNLHLFGAKNTDEIMRNYDEMLKANGVKKIRSNAVHAIEFIITSSKEKMEGMNRSEQEQYFKEGLEFLRKKFGYNNLLHAQVHFDEETPHLTAFFVPIHQKKLNCRHFLKGGNESKELLSLLQTEFHNEVGAKFGMERGIKKEKPRSHIETRTFYSVMRQINETLKDESLDELDKKTKVIELVERIDYLNDYEDIEQAIEKIIGASRDKEEREGFLFARDVLNKINEEAERRKNFMGYIKKDDVIDVLKSTVGTLKPRIDDMEVAIKRKLKREQEELEERERRINEYLTKRHERQSDELNKRERELNRRVDHLSLEAEIKVRNEYQWLLDKANEKIKDFESFTLKVGGLMGDREIYFEEKPFGKIMAWIEGLKNEITNLTAKVSSLVKELLEVRNELNDEKKQHNDLKAKLNDKEFITRQLNEIERVEHENREKEQNSVSITRGYTRFR